jgi:hypothetical protein
LAAGLTYRLRLARPVDGYVAPQFWVTYDHGFLRRGLPGSVLDLLAGGTPSHAQMRWAAIVLCLLGLVGCAVITVRVASSAREPLHRAAVVTILVWSPLTFWLFVRDFGRYDAVLVIALAGLVLLPAQQRSRVWVTVVAALLLAVACATEEIAFLIVAPVALVVVGPALWRRAAALAPGIAVTVASLVTTPSGAEIHAAVAEAKARGVAVPSHDAASTLVLSLRDNHRVFYRLWPWHELAAAIALWVLLAVVTAALIWLLTGRSRGFTGPAVFAAAATLLTLFGIDTRRWWGLALLGLLAWLAVHRTAAPPALPERVPAAAWALAALVLVVSVLTRGLPVDHVPPHPWDVSVQHFLTGQG